MSDESSPTTDEADVREGPGESVEPTVTDDVAEPDESSEADAAPDSDGTAQSDGVEEAGVSIDRRTVLKAGALTTITSIGASGFLLAGDADSSDDVQYGYGGTPIETTEVPTESTRTDGSVPTGATTATTAGVTATETRNATTERDRTEADGRVVASGGDGDSRTSTADATTTTTNTETATTETTTATTATTTTTELDSDTYGVQGYGEYGYGGVEPSG
jgi:hypothetical protein